jgi:hypothetical protein
MMRAGLLCSVRLVVPRAAVLLDHAGYLLRPTANGLAVAATSSAVTLFDAQLSRRNKVVASGAIEDVALSPSGRLAALIDDSGLRLVEVHRDNVRWRIVGKSYACHFSGTGETLWVARPAQPSGIWLELRETSNGGTIRKVHIADPFVGSAFTLAPHAEAGGILVWIASPDGAAQTIAVVDTPRELVATPLPLHDGYPPEPIPSTSDYLLVRDAVLERRAWHDHSVRDALHWPWLDDEELAVLALSPHRALWASRTGRLHLLDLDDMSYLEELAVSTHPPRPLSTYFPTDDPRWGTDLQQLCLVGPNLVLQFGDSQLHALALTDCL